MFWSKAEVLQKTGPLKDLGKLDWLAIGGGGGRINQWTMTGGTHTHLRQGWGFMGWIFMDFSAFFYPNFLSKVFYLRALGLNTAERTTKTKKAERTMQHATSRRFRADGKYINVRKRQRVLP